MGQPFESKVDFPLFPVFCFRPSLFGHLLTSLHINLIPPTQVFACVPVFACNNLRIHSKTNEDRQLEQMERLCKFK